METVQVITQLIGSLGFPIVMCFYLIKVNKESSQDHKEEVSQLRKAVENNTMVVQRVLDRMEVIESANRD